MDLRDDGGDDLIDGDRADLSSASVEDSAAAPGAHGDIGAVGLARTVDDAPHHGDGDRIADVGERGVHLLDDRRPSHREWAVSTKATKFLGPPCATVLLRPLQASVRVLKLDHV